MLIELYIEALLVDEDLADAVWELWDSGVIDNELAEIAWLNIHRNAWSLQIQQHAWSLQIQQHA